MLSDDPSASSNVNAAAGAALATHTNPGLPGALPDQNRLSILDLLRERYNPEKHSPLYRVILAGAVSPTLESKQDVGSHFQRVFRQLQTNSYSSFTSNFSNPANELTEAVKDVERDRERDGKGEVITGILIVIENWWVHVVEAKQKPIYSVLRHLASTANTHTTSSKVLLFQDDISCRIFPFWTSRVIDPNSSKFTSSSSTGVEKDTNTVGVLALGGGGSGAGNASVGKYVDVEGEKELLKVTQNVCSNLLHLGGLCSGSSKNDIKHFLEEFPDRHKDVLPKAEQLAALVGNSDLVAVEEWLEFFDTSSEHGNGWSGIVLERELTWPTSQVLGSALLGI